MTSTLSGGRGWLGGVC